MTAATATLLPCAALPAERIGVHAPASLPATSRLGTAHLAVASLAHSLAFYEQVLGFRVLLPTRADLGRYLRHVRALGLPVGSSDHNYSEASYLADPNDFTIEVYRDRPRAEWQVSEQGEIQSALDPLDLPGVLAAAGDAPWQGLPAGTTLGHLHFYTGDLRQAAAFYHRALGFDVATWMLPGALFVGAGGYHHHLGLNVWAAGSPVATEADARLRAAGYPVTPTLTDADYNAKLVGHLRSDDFFGVDKYPTATFVITSITPLKGDAAGNNATVTGNLALKGKTNPLSFSAKVGVKNGVAAATGTATIDRSKYDVKYGSTFFGAAADKAIDDNFQLSFNVIAKASGVAMC